MSAKFSYYTIKQVIFQQLYFNYFFQCEYNCKKVKQILNLYSLFNYIRIYKSISKKILN